MASQVIHPEDEQLVSQLASLQKMHDQIYHLRTLPKALVTPVTEMFNFLTLPSIGGDAPAKLYARIQKIAIDGSDDIESFKQSWKSSDTQDLWQRTLNEPYPQGTDVWRTDYIKMVEESKAYQQRQASIIERAAIDVRNPKDVMDDFREKQQSVKVELDGPSSPLPCNIRVAGMIFRVIATAQGDKVEYGVQHNKGSGPTHLQDGILKHLNARRAKGNLEYLLDMIASYQDVKRRLCDKCSKLIDQNLTFPFIRNDKGRTSAAGEKTVEWEALHAACA